MRAYSFRLIGAAALALATPPYAQLTPAPNPITSSMGGQTSPSAGGTIEPTGAAIDINEVTIQATGDHANATPEEHAAGAFTNVNATPLPSALLLLAFGLIVAWRAAGRDRRRMHGRADSVR